MKKALIIYGSTTGNTEAMSEIIKHQLEASGIEVTLQDVVNSSVSDLTAPYDALFLGCPAYGDDEIELQDDFAEFYETMDGIALNGKNFAVFAPGDSSYEYFCGSVDMLESKMLDLGGSLITEGLKIDGDPDSEKAEIEDWTLLAAKKI